MAASVSVQPSAGGRGSPLSSSSISAFDLGLATADSLRDCSLSLTAVMLVYAVWLFAEPLGTTCHARLRHFAHAPICSRNFSIRVCFRCSSCPSKSMSQIEMSSSIPKPIAHRQPNADARHTTNQNLPPHLREVCAILAAGLLRLRSRAAEETGDQGEVSLRFPAHPSACAIRTNRRPA